MINAISFLFLGTVGWGLSLILIKILLVSLTPTEIVLYRMSIGAVFLILTAKLLDLRPDNVKHLLIDGLVIGILHMSMPVYLITLAERNVSSSLASTINGLTPLFTFLLGMIFFASKEKFNFFNILSILLGLFGILIVHYDFSIGHGRVIDLITLVAASISFGMAANYIKYYAKTKEPILIAAMAAVISTLIMLFWKLISAESGHWGVPANAIQSVSLFWLGAIGSGFCLYLYFFLIRRVGALNASMTTYLMTMTSVIVGIVFFDEQISNVTWLGCACILSSLILVNHASQLDLMIRYKGLTPSN